MPDAVMPDVDRLAAARSLLQECILLDGHNDLPWQARVRAGYDWAAFDIGMRREDTHTDLVRAREGCLGAQFWSVYVPSSLPGPEAVVATLEQVDGVREMVRSYPDRLGLATSARGVREVVASGRMASLLGAEGGHSIDSSLGVLRMLHALGVRYLTLTHNDNTPWADSATDEALHGGLTDLGRDIVREMNRIGMIVDLSHVAATTMRDALSVTRAPVLFTHSNAAAVCDVPRNVPDDVLALTRAGDGVVCATFVPAFSSQACADWRAEAAQHARAAGVDPRDWPAFEAFQTRFAEHRPRPTANLLDVVAHVEHLREAMGVRHVGIGADLDGTGDLPVGLEDVASYPRLFAALRERRWSDAELRLLAGENTLRVLQAVEDAAA